MDTECCQFLTSTCYINIAMANTNRPRVLNYRYYICILNSCKSIRDILKHLNEENKI